MGKTITAANIKKYRKKLDSSNEAKISMNAATRTDVRRLAMNWDAYRQIDHTFSHKVSGAVSYTHLTLPTKA